MNEDFPVARAYRLVVRTLNRTQRNTIKLGPLWLLSLKCSSSLSKYLGTRSRICTQQGSFRNALPLKTFNCGRQVFMLSWFWRRKAVTGRAELTDRRPCGYYVIGMQTTLMSASLHCHSCHRLCWTCHCKWRHVLGDWSHSSYPSCTWGSVVRHFWWDCLFSNNAMATF